MNTTATISPNTSESTIATHEIQVSFWNCLLMMCGRPLIVYLIREKDEGGNIIKERFKTHIRKWWKTNKSKTLICTL